MSPWDAALEQIAAARRYSLDVLDTVSENNWFRMPPGDITHVGWQAGHLAVAQFNLGLVRTEGASTEDTSLLPTDFRELFGKGSMPQPGADAYPAAAEIRRVMQSVHAAVIDHGRTLDKLAVDAPVVGAEHPQFSTKLGALLWCGQHEMIHAGQIALLRRLLGQPPRW